ncbi:hypothetical protein C8J32_10453 [Rhizobium sp. PP-CC-3A-592]|nr:hypothetical protein C8J32_10453 [Rhizobium sp. PP-CC-3A-592]
MPIIADTDLPARLREVCQTVTDWNTAQANGWYMANNASNAPVTNTWFFGESVNHGAAGWCAQTVTAFTADGASDSATYRRDLNNGSWSAWYRIRQSETELDLRYDRIFDEINGGAF